MRRAQRSFPPTSKWRLFLLLMGFNVLRISAISYPNDTVPEKPMITRYSISYIGGGAEDCHESEWHCLGPTGIPGGYTSSKGQGQIHALAFSPEYEEDSTMYAGSNFGGLWIKRGKNPWQPIGEGAFPYSSISDIAIDPLDKSRIYVSTGDAENKPHHFAINTDDGTSSIFTPIFTSGVFRSDDGGRHWQSINGKEQALLKNFDQGGAIRKLLLDPSKNRLWAVSSEGVYVTNNPGAHSPEWKRTSIAFAPLDSDDALKGIAYHPSQSDTVYISGKDIYKTYDGGEHWDRMTGKGTELDWDSLPGNFEVERINIAVSKAAPDRLYAYVVGKEGTIPAFYIYLLDGMKWSKLKYGTTRSPFELVTPTRTAIAVSPTHPDTLFYGTTKVYGGNIHYLRGYSPYSGSGYHADVHVLAFEPGGKRIFAGTDGGISVKKANRIGSSGWQFLSEGLQVKTVYRFGDRQDRPDILIAGNQDTGTDILIGEQWTTIEGGDGYNGKVDITNGLGYGSGSGSSNQLFSYDFITKRKTDEWHKRLWPIDPTQGSPARIKAFQLKNHPKTEQVWIAMTELYARKVHRPAKRDDTVDSLWELRSDIGKYIPEQWKRQLTEFDICASQPDYIYLIVNGYQNDEKNGFLIQPRLFLSTTGGCNGIVGFESDTCFYDVTPNLIKNGIVSKHYQPVKLKGKKLNLPVITSVVFAPNNPLKAWITFTGYEPGIKVWKTQDGGEHWTNADPEGSLHNLPVNDIVYQYGSPDMLYIGTDAGIFYKDSTMSKWTRMCHFPNVRVTELRINYCVNKLRAATFGRGIWEGELIVNTTNLAGAPRIIREEEHWTTSRGIDRDILIPSGHTLFIESPFTQPITLSLPAKGRIILEDGAHLHISNAHLTNGCGAHWGGIIWDKNDAMRPPTIRFNQVQLSKIR